MIEQIVENFKDKNKDKKIIVRVLKENKRMLSNKNNMGYFNIGKGNYSSNEYEYWLKEDCFSIDIIPINIYSKDNKIHKLIYRTRIFIPPNYIKNKTGYVS